MTDIDARWVKAKHAAQIIDVSPITIDRWRRRDKINYIVLPNGRFLYDAVQLKAGNIAKNIPLPKPPPPASSATATAPKKKILYCRVSSPGQRGDLERQINTMRTSFPDHKLVTDIGSGINFKRKGLLAILDDAMRGNVEEVVVAHRDRLARFAFDLLKWIFDRFGTRLVVARGVEDRQDDISPKNEFVEDLLAIVHVFAARFHGLRRYEKGVEKAPRKRQKQQTGRDKGKRVRIDEAEGTDDPQEKD